MSSPSRAFKAAPRDYPNLYDLAQASRLGRYWNFMKLENNREAADRRLPRTPLAPRPQGPSQAPALTDWVWPGVTRAQLREHIIEQIG